MTYIETTVAFVIICLFLTVFSQVLLPAYNVWSVTVKEYRTAHSVNFIAKSFKNECIKPDRNMERWKQEVSAVKELEKINISEYLQDGIVRALKAECSIGDLNIEIIGVCAP